MDRNTLQRVEKGRVYWQLALERQEKEEEGGVDIEVVPPICCEQVQELVEGINKTD